MMEGLHVYATKSVVLQMRHISTHAEQTACLGRDASFVHRLHAAMKPKYVDRNSPTATFI
jgi:hypothetical protein